MLIFKLKFYSTTIAAVMLLTVFAINSLAQNGFSANGIISESDSEPVKALKTDVSEDNVKADLSITETKNPVPAEADTAENLESANAGPKSIYDNKVVGGKKPQVSQGQQQDNNEDTKPKPFSTWKMMGSLILVIIVIFGIALAVRRFMPGGKVLGNITAVKVLSRTAIGPRQSLCLVRLGSRILLVGLSSGHMTTLQSIDDPDEISRIMGLIESESNSSITNSFGSLFSRESSQYDAEEDYQSETEVDDSQFGQSNSELAGLLKKVKGLAKMRSKP
ncbi:MAG: FliO/MopB family protein [Phycisphaerae bacterium]|nr:FliO/MopB family protein [Phycisphaerae bacterium]